MTVCYFIASRRAGEPLEYGDRGRVTNWAEWTEFDCTNEEALNEDGCPFLDDNEVECPIKERHIQDIEDWAVMHLALTRKGRYTAVRKLMQEDEG